VIIVAAVALMSAAPVFLAMTQNPPPDLGARPRGEPIAPGDKSAAQGPPTPRLADGKPNLGRVPGEKGVWELTANSNFARFATNAPPGWTDGGKRGGAPAEPWVPFQPWAAALYNYHSRNESKYDPEGYCLPPGGPRQLATPFPAEILQLPDQQRIIMIFEGGAHVWREIYMDGRPHPSMDAIKGQTWIGHSVGHWEGDTLVVDTVGYNEGTWLDFWGHPHTDLLHVIERLTRPNKNVLHYEATIDDPGAYTKPWTVAWNISWKPGVELQEYICQENNSWMKSMHDDFGQPVFYTAPSSK
jgi:hypothetical protein